MPRTKISEFSSTAANNTDIDSINIAENCPPSSINDAIRELMAQLKDFQTGAQGDSFNGPIGTSTAAAGAFTTLSATGAITSTLATGTAPLVIASTTKVANLNVDLLDGADWASPAALGSTTPAAGSFTTLGASSTATLNTLVSSGATITGGTINGMTIGATTASTGAFTTLSASSSVTLSGGTANGVAYLNGSKVVTSGSALTFDGSTLGSSFLNIGSASSFETNSRVAIKTSAGKFDIAAFGGSSVQLMSSGAFASYVPSSSFDFIWLQGASEQMRLTSTGLGIGTSSPASQLDVSKTGDAIISLTSAGVQRYQLITRSGGNFEVYDQSSAASRLTLTQSGNLGLGVTPSAWGTYKAFQFGAVGAVAANTSACYFGNNWYTDGTNNKYINTATAGIAGWEGNAFKWYQAPSGTAGNAITFTQAMTLDSSGNLGIGTSSPAVKLDVIGAIKATIASTASNNLRVGNSGSNFYFATENSAGGSFCVGSLAYSGLLVSDNAIQLSTTNGGSVQATLTTSGNLGLGVTPSAWGSSWKAMQIGTAMAMWANGNDSRVSSNVYFDGTSHRYLVSSTQATMFRQSAGEYIWYNAPSGTAGNAITFTQALTLDASGQLLLGKTSTAGTAGGGVLYLGKVDAARDDGDVAVFKHTTAGNTVGSISITSSATAYNTSSDYRLKNITGPITTSGAYIDSLNPVEGTWKADGSTFVGLIAHEVQEASRTKVATGIKDGDEMQAMDYSNSELIANLIAEVKSLRQRVATLEAK